MVGPSLSVQVQEMEERIESFRKILKFVKEELTERGFEAFNESVFVKNIEFFQTLYLNKTFSYCPFPKDCRYYMCCTEKYCNADECDNGYARRGY